MARMFTWDAWDYDLNGDAYIISKSECPLAVNVPDFICGNEHIDHKHKLDMVVKEGWCKFQIRSDWDNSEGEVCGGYFVKELKEYPKDSQGKKKRGWFPVWIVRKGKWAD